ncbi:MAG: hypothetical protein Ct9H90mP28_4270 [Paracoccaceae bacterium]|nr:MAG: hypothetical protein Ct9H90mP28_4270 [Paracoccaceae bacterium]
MDTSVQFDSDYYENILHYHKSSSKVEGDIVAPSLTLNYPDPEYIPKILSDVNYAVVDVVSPSVSVETIEITEIDYSYYDAQGRETVVGKIAPNTSKAFNIICKTIVTTNETNKITWTVSDVFGNTEVKVQVIEVIDAFPSIITLYDPVTAGPAGPTQFQNSVTIYIDNAGTTKTKSLMVQSLVSSIKDNVGELQNNNGSLEVNRDVPTIYWEIRGTSGNIENGDYDLVYNSSTDINGTYSGYRTEAQVQHTFDYNKRPYKIIWFASDFTGRNFTNDQESEWSAFTESTLIRETRVFLQDAWPPQIIMKNSSTNVTVMLNEGDSLIKNFPVTDFIINVQDDINDTNPNLGNVSLIWNLYRTDSSGEKVLVKGPFSTTDIASESIEYDWKISEQPYIIEWDAKDAADNRLRTGSKYVQDSYGNNIGINTNNNTIISVKDDAGPVIGDVSDITQSMPVDANSKFVTFDLQAPSVDDNYSSNDGSGELKLKWKITKTNNQEPTYDSSGQLGSWGYLGYYFNPENSPNGWISPSGKLYNLSLHYVDSPLKIEWFAIDKAGNESQTKVQNINITDSQRPLVCRSTNWRVGG